jgi:hypothetical protein
MMNLCFLRNPKQTPLAGDAHVGVAHRWQEEAWRLPVRPLEAVLRGRMSRCVWQAPTQPPLGRHPERLHRVVHRQAGGPHSRCQRRRLSGWSRHRIQRRRYHAVQLIVHLKPTCYISRYWSAMNSCALGRRSLLSVLEHDVCRGVAHPVVQRPGVLPRWWAEVHFVWQPSQESSILAMSRAFDDYYIMDCGVISTPEVTQRRTDNNDHFVIFPIVGVAFCAGLSLILFDTHLLFCLSKRVWWFVSDDWRCTRELLPAGVTRALQWWDHGNRGIYRSLHDTDGCNVTVKQLD